MTPWLGAQDQVNLSKKAKTSPHYVVTPKNAKPKTNFFFKSELQDLLNPSRIWTDL